MRLEEARVTHLAGVRGRFLDRFGEAELDALADFWERIVARPPRTGSTKSIGSRA